MFRLSKLLEKLEDKSEAKFKSWLARNKAKLPMRVPAVIVGWYFYGMFLNSLRLGISFDLSYRRERDQKHLGAESRSKTGARCSRALGS